MTLDRDKQLGEQIVNQLDNYRRFAHDYDDDENVAVDAIMQAAKAYGDARVVEELEDLDSHYWGNDDLDSMFDMIASGYIERRIAELTNQGEEKSKDE